MVWYGFFSIVPPANSTRFGEPVHREHVSQPTKLPSVLYLRDLCKLVLDSTDAETFELGSGYDFQESTK